MYWLFLPALLKKLIHYSFYSLIIICYSHFVLFALLLQVWTSREKCTWYILSCSCCLMSVMHIQGQQKWSSCSGFGRPSFSQGKIKFHFYKKQVIYKSASVIFELVRLIILDRKSQGWIQMRVIGVKWPPFWTMSGKPKNNILVWK